MNDFNLIPHTASVSIWAMVAASLLPLFWSYVAKFFGGFERRDNAHPRQFYATLTGRACRAHATQQNGFEGLPIFLAAVLTAMLFFVPQQAINNLSVLYVVLRLIYGAAYIANLTTFRSIIWALAMACPLMLFYLAIKVSV